jgi:hypothetical protein
MLRAYDDTSRFKTNLGSVSTIMTLGCGIAIRVYMDGVIGASLHTGLAADADTGVKIDDTIISLIHGCNRANPRAWRIGAMVAASDLKMTAGVWKSACFYVLDPGTIDTQRHFILALASGRASVAPDTLAIIDNEAVVHKVLLPRCDTWVVKELFSFSTELVGGIGARRLDARPEQSCPVD